MGIKHAYESGKLDRDFEECILRRAKFKVAEDLAEQLASGLAATLLAKQREMEARANETIEQRKEREQREAAKQKERQKQEEEYEREQARELEKARKIDADNRKKRPEFVAKLLSMDLKTAQTKEIIDVMKKLGLNPAGCLDRNDLIAALKEGVPELKMKLAATTTPVVATTTTTANTSTHSEQPPQTSSKLLIESLNNLDYDTLQGVADSTLETNLQTADLHGLKILLSHAQLKVADYPDRDSMIHALEQVKRVATMRKRNKSMCYGTVYQSNEISAGMMLSIMHS